MKLYLSSNYLGDRPELLHELLPVGSKVAIIPNAGDHKRNVLERDAWVAKQAEDFATLGYEAECFDLREYFDSNERKLRQKLSDLGMVWLTGGNSFILRKAMAQSSFDAIITDMVKNNEIVYGGFSAGACVATPTLRGIDECDDPYVVVNGYRAETVWKGLDLVPYSIVPHYDSEHKESHLMDAVIEELERNSLPYKTLRDGEVIIVKDTDSHVL